MKKASQIFSVIAIGLAAAINLPAFQDLDPDNRWMIRDFYQYIYNSGGTAELGWTGDYETGTAGTLSPDWQEATKTRFEYYRAMSGIPSSLMINEAYSQACQEAALMMSVARQISHFPPDSWMWYTEDAALAARMSNLAFGSTGRDSIDGYMSDFGETNKDVGHRRWILYPHTTQIGNGDAPGQTTQGGYIKVNALWVIPENPVPRPPTRDTWVAWPPKGYVPAPVIYARWSFSYPGADFSNATVSMTVNGSSVPVALDSVSSPNFGEPSIVWVPNNMDTSRMVRWPTPAEDETVSVSVENVMISGESQNFAYEIIIFDPNKASDSESEQTLTPLTGVHPSVPTEFASNSRTWSEGTQGRLFVSAPYNETHGAENGDFPFLSDIADGYNPIQNTRVSSGSMAYYLPNPDRTPQILTFEEEFHISDASPSISFSSSLAWATDAQYASVDINTGDGENWISLWSESGLVENNNAFTPVTIDLTEFAGKTARIRFRYDFTSAFGYWDSNPFTGWAFDDITFNGIRYLTDSEQLPATETNILTATFDDTLPVYMQARGMVFDGKAIDWGPSLLVQPTPYTTITAPLNTWNEDPVMGWVFGSENDWVTSVVMGWIHTASFPWIWTDKGWFHYISGSVRSTLWLYHPDFGYAYTNENLGGWFNHEPYTSNDWQTFRSPAP